MKSAAILAIVLSIAAIAVFSTSVTAIMADSQKEDTPSNLPPVDAFIEMPDIQGSIDLREILTATVKTEFSDAANAAASSVDGGMVLNGGLGVHQGYYVYNFQVMDKENKVHHVIVDAGNGKVLYTSEGIDMGIGALGLHDGMFYKFHGPAMPIGTQKVVIHSEP
jgi:uncharacterized membrane protein YkoI